MKHFIFLALLFSLYNCGGDTKPETTSPEPSDETVVQEPTVEKVFLGVPITEADPQVKGEEIDYETDRTKMKGYLAYDDKKTGKRPGVLVVHEWWGHNDYARKRADMLAELGYVALALDMYGDGKQADHPDDAGKFASAVFANIDEAKARFEAALETLREHEMVDGSKLAAIGYCFGGSVVLSMANAGFDLAAVGAFHSGVDLPIMPAEGESLDTKILVANGNEDPFVSLESVVKWTKAMEAIDADYEYLTLNGATHGFTNPAADANGKKFDLPLAYNEAADRKSWASLQALLDRAFD